MSDAEKTDPKPACREDNYSQRRSSRRLKNRQTLQLLVVPHGGSVVKIPVDEGVVILTAGQHRPVAGASAFRNDCGILPSE